MSSDSAAAAADGSSSKKRKQPDSEKEYALIWVLIGHDDDCFIFLPREELSDETYEWLRECCAMHEDSDGSTNEQTIARLRLLFWQFRLGFSIKNAYPDLKELQRYLNEEVCKFKFARCGVSFKEFFDRHKQIMCSHVPSAYAADMCENRKITFVSCLNLSVV